MSAPRVLRARALPILGLAALASISMANNDDGGCGRGSFQARDGVTADTTSPPDTAAPDTSPPPACEVASDCEGLGDVVACDGAWQCVEGACSWHCETRPPEGCFGDEQCPEGQRCNAADVCLPPPGCDPGEDCPAVCYGQCVADGPVDGCYANDDCGEGEFCSFDDCTATPAGLVACVGTCRPEESCTSQADCDEGELCACVPPGFSMPSALVACELQCVPRDAQCFADQDCKEGYRCADFQCTPVEEYCFSNDDCPRGWTCEDDCGAGSEAGDRIACPRVCKAPPPDTTCGADGQTCNEGETCEETCWIEVVDCACADGDDGCACPGELVCVSVCVPDDDPGACTGDRDCPAGQVCACDPDEAGLCLPTCVPSEAPWDCESDADCRDGVCRIEVCEVGEPTCDADGVCIPGETTCHGYCQPPYDCTSDAECRDGATCKIDWEGCGQAPPADGDRMMPPLCQGWCTGPVLESCGPDGLVCQAGEVCEETWDCGTGSDERRPCFARYACVPAEGTCRSDADCASPERCLDGVCEVQFCWEGRCDEGYACESRCDAIEPLPNGLILCPMVCVPEARACADDCDCNIDEGCVGGVCTPISGANDCRWIGCTGELDCARHEQCLIMCPLCLPDSPCPPCQGECVLRSFCASDDECAEGEVCDFNAMASEPPPCDCQDCSCETDPMPPLQGVCARPAAE